jgi:hypothetical protein
MAFKVDQLEQILDRPLNEEESRAIDLWEKGKLLAQQVMAPGWNVVLEILQSYPLKATADLMEIDPAQDKEVLAQQAVAFATQRMFTNFKADVLRAIEAAKHPPEIVLQELRRITPGVEEPAKEELST